MVLVDTSVWVSHLGGDADLKSYWISQVMCHPFIIGEIAVEISKENRSFYFSSSSYDNLAA
jgi:predicted nucleic acid-binding protein